MRKFFWKWFSHYFIPLSLDKKVFLCCNHQTITSAYCFNSRNKLISDECLSPIHTERPKRFIETCISTRSYSFRDKQEILNKRKLDYLIKCQCFKTGKWVFFSHPNARYINCKRHTHQFI